VIYFILVIGLVLSVVHSKKAHVKTYEDAKRVGGNTANKANALGR